MFIAQQKYRQLEYTHTSYTHVENSIHSGGMSSVLTTHLVAQATGGYNIAVCGVIFDGPWGARMTPKEPDQLT